MKVPRPLKKSFAILLSLAILPWQAPAQALAQEHEHAAAENTEQTENPAPQPVVTELAAVPLPTLPVKPPPPPPVIAAVPKELTEAADKLKDQRKRLDKVQTLLPRFVDTMGFLDPATGKLKHPENGELMDPAAVVKEIDEAAKEIVREALKPKPGETRDPSAPAPALPAGEARNFLLELSSRTLVLGPLAQIKSGHAQLYRQVPGFEKEGREAAQATTQAPDIDKRSDAFMTEWKRLRVLVDAERARGAGAWGLPEPPADVRTFQAEVALAFVAESDKLLGRYKTARELILASPARETGKVTEALMAKLVEQVPPERQPALVRELGGMRGKLAGHLAGENQDINGLLADLGKAYDNAGLSQGDLTKAMPVLQGEAVKERDRLSSSAVPAAETGFSQFKPQFAFTEKRPMKIGGSVPALTLGDPNAPKPEPTPPPPPWWTQGLPAWEAAVGMVRPLDGSDPFKLAAAMAKRSLFLPVPPTEEEKIAERLGELARAAGRRELELKYQADRDSIRNGIKALQGKLASPTAAGLPQKEELDTLFKAIEDFKVHGFVSFLDGSAATPKSGKKKAAPATGGVAEHGRLTAEFKADAAKVAADAKAIREKSQAEAAKLAKPLKALSGQIEALDRGDQSGTPAAKAGLLPVRLKNFTERLAAPAAAAEAARLQLLEEDRVLLDAELIKARKALEALAVNGMASSYVHIADTILATLKNAPNKFLSMEGKSKDEADAHQAAVKEFMSKTWPALLKDMPALWDLLEPVWAGSAEGVRKDCAGQRGQAEKLLGLIKSMKESNFNPTLLDKDTLGLVLGDAEKGGDLGFMGQAMLKSLETKRLNAEKLTGLLGALKGIEGLKLDGSDSDAELLSRFFENPANKTLMEGTDLEAVVAQWTAAKQAEASGAPAAPGKPGAKEAYRNLIESLTFAQAQEEKPSEERTRAMLYLRHAQLNRSVYEYLTGPSATAADKAAYAGFLAEYEKDKDLKKEPTRADLDRQGALTDQARNLLRNFPEYKAMVRSQQANANLQGALEGLLETGDAGTRAALAKAGAPDLANLSQRAEKQTVLQWGIMAYQQGIVGRDSQAWEGMKDQMLAYYYGPDFKKATSAQSQALQGGTDEALRAFESGNFNPAALAGTFDGIVTPTISVYNAQTQKKEPQTFITSGFLKEIPRLQARDKEGRLTGRDQMLMAVWQGDGDSRSESFKGSLKGMLVAAADTNKKLAGLARATGPDQLPGADDPALKTFLLYLGEGASREKLAEILKKPRDDPDAASIYKYLDGLAAQFETNAAIIRKGVSSPEDADALAEAFRAAGLDVYDERLLKIAANPGGVSQEPADEEGRRNLAALRQLKRQPGLAENADGKAMFSALMSDLKNNKAPAQAQARSDQLLFTTNDETQAAYGKLAGVLGSNAAFSQLSGLLNALNEQKAANDDLMVMSQVNARTADGRLRQRLAGDLSLLMTQSHLSLRDGHAEDGLSVSGWLVGRGDDEKVVRRNKFSGEEADRIDPKSRRTTNNDVADVSVGLPPGTSKDGIQTVKLDSKGRPTGDYEFTSLDGSYRRSVADQPPGGAPGQEGRFASYRDKDGGTVYREVDENGAPKKGSKFFRVLDPALPPAKIEGAKEEDFRRVRELKVTTQESGQPVVHSMSFYTAAKNDQVLRSGPNEKGQVSRRDAVPGENVVLSLTRSGGGQIVQIDYESGTQFIRRGDVGWQFSLSEDYGGLNQGKSRTFMTFEDGKAVAQYSEYLEVNPETKVTALKRTVLNDPKNKIAGATITGTYTVATGFNAGDVKARFQAESKTGAGVAMSTEGKVAESVSVKFDHKGGKIGDQAYSDVARRVRSMLGENPGSDFNGDLAGLMQLFDGQVKRPGDIKGTEPFEVGFNFGTGGSASVSTRQWDKAANRVINDKPLNFRYTELPKENAELFSGPDTVQGREQKLQVSNTNRLKAIRDFLGDKSHAFVLYETDDKAGIPEFSNGKRRNRERVSSFVGRQNWSGAQRQYRVGEEGATYDKGGAGLLWGSDVMQGMTIKDMNGNTVKRYDYKVGTGTSVWNAAAKLGDYTSNSIRYNNWGENNPLASAILGGLAGGLIEGLLDPTNLLMMGGMAAAAKIAVKSAKAVNNAVKAGKTVSRTTKVIKQTSEFTVKTLPKAFKGLMYYQGGMAGYNLSMGAATGNLDMINQGVRGAAMLLPMDGIYHWMGKQSKSVFGGNKPPPDIGNKNLPGDVSAPPKDGPKPPPEGNPPPDGNPPPHNDPPPPGKNPPNADPPPPGKTPPPHVDPPPPGHTPPPHADPPPPGGTPPRVDPPAPQGNPPHGLPAPVPHSPLPSGIHASKPAGFDSGTLGSPSAGAIGGDITPRSGMTANHGSGPAAHSNAPGTAKAPEPIKAPEANKAPEAAPKTAPPAPKPADPIAVKEVPVRGDAASQRVEGGAPTKASGEPPKDLIAMGPRPEVTAAPHQAAPHQPKPAELDANFGRGPPQKKGGDFDPIHGDADGKFKTPEPKDLDGDFANPKEGGLRELKKAREQGFTDRPSVEPKQPNASQPRQTNTGEPRRQPSSKPVEPNLKPVEPGTPAKDPAPAPKEPAVRPVDAPVKPPEPAVGPQEPSIRPQDSAPQGDTNSRPQEAGTGPKTAPDKPGFFDNLNDRMVKVEGFLGKHFPTFAAAGRATGRKFTSDWNQTVLRHHQRVANFQAANPKVTAFIKGAGAVAQAPGNMLAGWGRKLNSVADGLVKPKAPGAAPDAPPELNAFGKFARAMGNRLQGAGLEGRTALDWTEARYSKVQDRPDFIKAAKAADLAGGEGVLHARTDPSTGRIVEISAKPFPPKEGSVDLELKVLKDGDGFELAGLAVAPGSRGKLASVAAEHLDYLLTESFKSPLTAKHAETLLGDPGLQAKIVAAMDPATRASEVELHWDKAKKQWSVEPIPGDPAAAKARMQLTKDLGSDTFRLTGFSGRGAPPSAAANLQTALMKGLADGLDLAGVKAAAPKGVDQALALKGAAPAAVETPAMRDNRARMGKAVDQSFELLSKFGPEGADADGFVKGLQRSDALPEPMPARKEAIAKLAQDYLGLKEPPKVLAPDTDPLSGAQIFILKNGDEVVGVYKVFTNNGKGPVTIMNELGAGRTLGSLGLKKSIPVDSLGAWRLGESGEIGYMMAGASGKDFYGYFKEIGKLEVGSPARAEKVAEIQGRVESMAKAMAEMHEAGPKGVMEAAEKKSSVEKALAGLEQMKSKLNPDTYRAMRSRLEKLGEGYISHDIPGHVTHGDAHPGNFFMDADGKITMIDLETSMESISKSGKGTKSPLGDVGRFVESMSLNNKLKGMNLTPEELSGLQQAFLAAYAKQAKLKPADFEAHRQYHQARMQVTALKYAKTQEDFDGLLAVVEFDLAKAAGADSAPWMKGTPEGARPLLEERVYRDVLTGAYNQRYLDDHASALLRDYQEAVMFDGDSFGSIDRSMRRLFGDTVGGLMADEVLARMIRRAEEGAAAAGKSVVVRKGGEEVVIFAKKGEGAKIAEAARHAGERFHADDLELAEVLAQFGRTHGVKGDAPTIMEAVRQQAVVDAKAKAAGSGQPESSVNLEQVRARVGTLSLGVARIDPSGAPDAALERAIKLADRALDHSKKAGGKNSVSEVVDDGSFRLRDRSSQGPRPPRIERAPVWESPEYQQTLKALGQTELESFLSAIHTDPKTGLGNRESIRENLAERLGAFDRLYKVEIDNFKAVNDHAELGHDAGDAMFKEFGKVVLEVRAEIAKELGVPESQVLHAARVVSKDFHVLAKDRTGELFAELLPKRLAEGDRLLAAVAAHKFGAGDPAFRPTAKQVELVRSWIAEQAKATGKDPARVGTATGHLARVEVPAHGDKGAAYDRAVQDATTVLEAQKAWRNAAARSELGAGPLAARVPVERYIPFETFQKLHPALEAGEVYHNYLHSMKVADMAFALASKRLPGDQAVLVAEIAMLHDLDPFREPGKAARVPATLELLRADFEGRLSIHGEKGRSVLKEVFGWDARKLAVAEAMIQRTEFPFDATHKNPAYAGAGNSPPERYEAMLRKLSPADRKFVLEEAAMLSEFADKSSWYATETFDGAAKIVDALAGEINAGIGKPVMDFSKLDTAGFLSTIGTEGAYAFDRALAAKLGLPELGLLGRSQAWELLPTHGRIFESNLKGFEDAKAALAKGESIDAAKARGAASAEAALKKPALGAGDQPSLQAARTALEALDPAGVRGLASMAAADLLGLPGVSGGTMRDLEPKSLKALETLAADLSVRILGDPAAPVGRSVPAANADRYRPDWTAENQKAFGSALEKSFGSLTKDGTLGFDRKAIAAAAEVVDALPAMVDRTGPAEAKAAADMARGEASARLVQEYLGLAERPRAVLPETLPTSGADVFLMRAGGKTIGVYKVYPKAHAEQMLADELAAGKILEGFGLKRSGLVRPLGTFRHGESGELGLLMEAAPGKDLFGQLREVGRLEPGSPQRVEALNGAEEAVRAVAASMAELHQAGKGTGISTKARRETLAKTLEYVDALASPAGNGNFADGAIPADVAEALKAKLKLIGKDYVRGKSPGAVVHGDSHPGNFMVQDGKVVIIDAESLLKSVGPGLKGTESPMSDVARFLESLPTNNKIKGINLEPGEIGRVQKAFLDAYADAGGLSPEAFQAQIAFFRAKFQVTALRYAANRAELDLVLDAIRTDLQASGTGLRSPPKGKAALDANALMGSLERGELAAVDHALAGRSPVISITAAKEFLKKGDVEVLRGFLKERGGGVGGAASGDQIADLQSQAILLGRVLKAKDAAVAGSAINENAPLLTRDKKLYNFLKAAGVAVEKY